MKVTKKTASVAFFLLLLGAQAFALEERDLRAQERLRDAILDDARVHSYALVVEVQDGVATIRGVVGSTAARDRVTEIARKVEGIRDVVNELIVRSDVKLADPEIELYVQEALARDPLVESSEVVVTSSSGVVELHGTVDSEEERDRAARIASRVLGVERVENDLTLPPASPAQMTDLALTAAVERALEPNFDDVEVLVERGVVTLSGTVGSPEEKARAEKLAFAAGATLVENELGVNAPPPPEPRF